MNTGAYYNDGSPIQIGDTIIDKDGIEVTVYYTKRNFRVAVRELDLFNGLSSPLNLFIIGGVTKKEDATKDVLNKQP